MMKTNKKPLKISFSTQKGGVGKSTLTTLLASVLHYRLGYNVVIFDCDFPQHSLTNMRERDKNNIMKNEYHKKAAMKQFQTINKKAYPIIKIKAEHALEKAAEYEEKSVVGPDIIFFDLPGTANTTGVLTTLKMMDFIFSPITADRLVVESALGFSKAFLELPKTIEGNKNPYFFLQNGIVLAEMQEMHTKCSIRFVVLVWNRQQLNNRLTYQFQKIKLCSLSILPLPK